MCGRPGNWSPAFHSQLSSRAGATPSPRREALAGVHGAGPQLALVLAAGRQLLAALDARGELVVVVQHAVRPQHVRDEVVGEDRQPVDVPEVGHAGQVQIVGGDLGALVEAGVGEERHLRQALGQRLGRLPPRLGGPPEAPSWLSPWA